MLPLKQIGVDMEVEQQQEIYQYKSPLNFFSRLFGCQNQRCSIFSLLFSFFLAVFKILGLKPFFLLVELAVGQPNDNMGEGGSKFLETWIT